ncbi:MAG: flagellar basal body-associated FliL family protein [Lautropia sp.]|nr:flagellar basal body-associated FliL family protein [Lautropia sp.]
MADNADNQAQEGKKKGKGLLIGILAAVLAGGGGAGWFFLKPAPDPEAEQQKKYAPAPAPIFVNLDPFTVNLADEGGERMAQMTIVLEMLNQNAADDLKKFLPAVRNELLFLLSSQSSKQILSLDGKQSLAQEISLRTAHALGWEEPPATSETEDKAGNRSTRVRTTRTPPPSPVVAVHFNQLLVQ